MAAFQNRTPCRLLLAVLLTTASACQEPSIRVTFDIPEEYRQNSQCLPDCDASYDACMVGGEPVPPDCDVLFENCISYCGDDQDPVCREFCQERQGFCHGLGQLDGPGECDRWFEECWQSCTDQNQYCEQICDEEFGACLAQFEQGPDPARCESLLNACRNDCGREVVVQSSLQVFLPPVPTPPEQPFGCEDLAFGQVAAAVLSASLAQEVFLNDVDDAEKPLVPLSRTGPKILLARAFDASDQPVVVGCAEVGDIDGDMHVRLEGEPTAVMTIDSATADGEPDSASGLPEQVRVLVTDVLSRPLEGAEVHWTVAGPAGTGSTDGGSTDGSGQLWFMPDPPPIPGPVMLEIRTRWLRGDPPVIKAFSRPGRMQAPLPSRHIEQFDIGRIGPEGEAGYAGWFQGDSADGMMTSYLFYGYRRSQAGDMTYQEIEIPAAQDGGAPVMGLVPGSVRDRVVVVVVGGWNWCELDPEGARLETIQVEVPGQPVAVVPIGRCDPDVTGESLLIFDGADAAIYGVGGEPLGDHAFAGLAGLGSSSSWQSGCVRDQDGEEHRMLIGGDSLSGWRMFVEVSGQVEEIAPDKSIRQVAFSPRLGDEAGTLLAGRLGLDSPEIARLQLRHQPSVQEAPVLEEIEHATLFAVPEAVGAGDVDGDGRTDLVGLFPLVDGYHLQVLLGLQHGGKPVSATMPVGEAEEPPLVWTADFDGDGVDDLSVLRLLGCDGQGAGEECYHLCEQEYEECLNQGDPQQCEERYGLCIRQCEQSQQTCTQYLDIHLMGG